MVTVTTLGSLGGSSAKQSPTCKLIYFSVRGFRVAGGAATAVVVLTGVVAAVVDVRFVDVCAGLRSPVPQADSSVSAATAAAKPNPAFISQPAPDRAAG
jgi:hypothetical protein